MSETNQRQNANGKTYVPVRDKRNKNWFWQNNFLYDDFETDEGVVTTFAAVIGSSASQVYGFLTRLANEETQRAFPSIPTIAFHCGLSDSAVTDVLHIMVDFGMVAREAREADEGDATSNEYVLLDIDNWKIGGGKSGPLSDRISKPLEARRNKLAARRLPVGLRKKYKRLKAATLQVVKNSDHLPQNLEPPVAQDSDHLGQESRPPIKEQDSFDQNSSFDQTSSEHADGVEGGGLKNSFSGAAPAKTPMRDDNTPLPGLAAVSVPARPSVELTHFEGIVERLLNWAQIANQELSREQARRIVAKTNLAARDVIEMSGEQLTKHLKDFKKLKFSRALFDRTQTTLARDVEYLRWLLWLWPLQMATLKKENYKGDLAAAFVYRAGFAGDDAKGESNAKFPDVTQLEALIGDDNARINAKKQQEKNERDIEARRRESARVEALNVQYRALPEEARKAIYDEVTRPMENYDKIKMLSDQPTRAIMARIRTALAEGWTFDDSEAQPVTKRGVAFDAPQYVIEAALAALKESDRARIESEARAALEGLGFSVSENNLRSRVVSVFREEIRAGRIEIEIDPEAIDDKRRAA